LKQIHIKLSELLHRELRIQAAIKGQTLQDYVVDAIKNKIALDRSSTDLAYAIEESISDNNTE
jgi:plasmid stability protein